MPFPILSQAHFVSLFNRDDPHIFNGHFRNRFIGGTIYKASISGNIHRKYGQKYGTFTYLHFRILKISLYGNLGTQGSSLSQQPNTKLHFGCKSWLDIFGIQTCCGSMNFHGDPHHPSIIRSHCQLC